MLVDIAHFPIIWMRAEPAHFEHDHDEEKLMQDILARNEFFVMIADRTPNLADTGDIKSGGREKAKLFKTYGKEFQRLCVAMILVGRLASMPQPLQKALKGITAALGVPLVFASDKNAAIEYANESIRAKLSLRAAGAPLLPS